ncbi:Endonuclease MutS2 [bioreactor metagenome]|uniref:Endonuclease MutS2 n=1 Tax=bioreactor metagenome TaxID=1076179 RepID=A0A645BEB6_9ZZZZ
MSVSAVVPNDVSFGPATKGVLIKGKNNSGKTVFLRSIGTAQLFAQAGLPVCAESASISIRRGLYTHFAAAEKELNGYQSAGRFEQEVSDIADIVRKAESCSLVLMNETFQTTSYSEGAEGIFNILKYFEEMNITWVFVSHLNDIFKMFSCDGSRIMLLGTSESTKYKLDSIIY